MSEVKQSIHKPPSMPVTNGFGKHDSMSNGLRAAAVHGLFTIQFLEPLHFSYISKIFPKSFCTNLLLIKLLCC
jgi:hypothetical protein